MFKIGFFQGVLLALIFSVLGAFAHFVLAPVFGSYHIVRLLLALFTLLYLVYLVQGSGIRSGRMVVALSWLGVSVLAWLFCSSLLAYISAHMALIWLVRAFICHKSVLAALLDLGLMALSLLIAVAVSLQSGSVFMTLWCFFLMQALFVFIPNNGSKKPQQFPPAKADRFEEAYRNAEKALRRISSVSSC